MAARVTPERGAQSHPAHGSARTNEARGRARGSHALLRLEWPEVLSRISALASSEAGAAHVRGLVPERSRDAAESALRVADEMIGMLLKIDWMPPSIPDVGSAL